MLDACTPILLGVASLVLEVKLVYSPWSSKNIINRNRLKEFMQVWIDVTCMYTNFGGRGLSSFRDTATLKNGQISLSDHYSPWSSKNLIDQNQPKKFMQVGIDVKCMHIDFSGRGFSSFEDKISLWSIVVEKYNQLESAQKNYASRH